MLVDVFLPDDDLGEIRTADRLDVPPLILTMRVDGTHLDRWVSGDEDGSAHRRSGSEHHWVVPRPRHLQRFTPGATPHVELVVDASSCADGTVRSRPAVNAISAWAAASGVMPVHAAAVARGGKAVLLVGAGGRGKTTTALTLATRGWQLIADDVCFLESSPAGTVVHGLYRTAVLTVPMAERLGAAAWEGLGRTHAGKLAYRLPPWLPVARCAALHAVVTVDHTGNDAYRVTDLTPGAARSTWLEAFTPAMQTHGPTPGWLAAYARTARAQSVTQLTLGWDAGRLDDVLAGLLDSGSGAQ